jgi:hypothetical protein
VKCKNCGEETKDEMTLCSVYCYSSYVATLVKDGMSELEAKRKIFDDELKNDSKNK